MTTNILAIITTLLLTNTTEHWPQKYVQDTSQYPIGGMDNLMIGPGHHIAPIYPTIMVPDIAAATKVVETTITRQRLLSAEADGVQFTNVLSNEVTEHYEADWRLVQTNATRSVLLSHRIIRGLDGATYTIFGDAEISEPTNWWQEVGYWTNAPAWVPSSVASNAVYLGTKEVWVGRRSLPLKPEQGWTTNGDVQFYRNIFVTNDTLWTTNYWYFSDNLTNNIGESTNPGTGTFTNFAPDARKKKNK